MGLTPVGDGTLELIQQLSQRVSELERKSLSSVAVSNGSNSYFSIVPDPTAVTPSGQPVADITIGYGDGTTFLKTIPQSGGKVAFQILDNAGNVMISNNTAAGWGLTQPNLATPFYPVNTDAAEQDTTNDSNWYVKYRSGHIINHSTVHISARMLSSGGGAGNGRMQWYTSLPANTANPSGGTLMLSASIILNTGYAASGTYTFPTNMFGQLVYVTYETQMTVGVTGSDWVSCSPIYFYGAGS